MTTPRRPAVAGVAAACIAGIIFLCVSESSGGIRTVPKRGVRGSESVREAMKHATEEGRVEALIRLLGGDDLPTSLEAMEALAAMGSPVVPRLVSEMRCTQNNWLIGGALVRMGSQAVSPLVELLEEADEGTAVDCIYLLGEIQDRRAVPTLVRHLEDPRAKVRMYSVTSLLQIGGPRAVEAVLSRLTREGKALESFIVEALLRYGRKSVEPILQSLTSENPRVRMEAAFLLGGLGDARAADPLVGALNDPDAGVRRNAAFALGELSASIVEAEGAVHALTGLLADPSPEVVEAARGSLVRFGDRAVDSLLVVCRDGQADEVIAGLNALREIGSGEAEALMIEKLGDPDRQVRVAAVAGLISVGSKASVEPLLDALRDEDLRWFATLALEKLGPENPKLFFASRPNDPTMSLRTQILVRLGSSVVPVLLDYLQDEAVGRRASALWILGEIAEPSTARDVARLLPDPELGWLAGRALHRMGADGLEELLRYVQSPPSEKGGLEAVEALSLFEDRHAWDGLEELLALPVPRVMRVRAAVLLSLYSDPERVDRLRAFLDSRGQDLWPDVKAALQAEGQIR